MATWPEVVGQDWSGLGTGLGNSSLVPCRGSLALASPLSYCILPLAFSPLSGALPLGAPQVFF